MTNERYAPYEPLNTLKPIGPNIWIADGGVLEWGYAGLSFPFPTRMTIIRLTDGGLWVHSPIAPDETLLAEVDALGPVRHLVSSNMLHHVSIGPWAARYPEARAWASPNVRKRSTIVFTDDLEDRPPKEWADVIDQRIAYGTKALVEVVFFHKPSRVLILTDLIENFEPQRLPGLLDKFFMWVGGVMAPKGSTPRDVRLTFMGGHKKLRPVIDWMIGCAPEKVVIAHGKWFEKDGTEEIRRAFSWV